MLAPASSSARIGCYVLATKIQSTRTFEAWQSQYADARREAHCDGEFVVKRLLPELAENPRLVEQYAQRGERAKRLRHEGISSVVDVVVNGEDCCVVCEPLEGNSLREILNRLHQSENSLPVWFAVHVTSALSAALAHAHSGGITQNPAYAVYHQDVSAENVLITPNGEVKLVDFGLSRTALLGIEVSRARRWSDSGEFDLWAPHFGDAQSDIQGLGRVLYELLTGRAPGRRWIPPSHYVAWITTDLDTILMRMLGTSERYASMLDVCNALQELSSRQRQTVDASHLSGLLRLVMLSMPPATSLSTPTTSEEYAEDVQDSERRSVTILPGAIYEPRDSTLPETLPETIERLEDVLLASAVEPFELPPPETTRTRRPSSHDWDAAVDSARRASVEPHALNAENSKSGATDDAATKCFEHGLDRLKHGELHLAELAWLRGLDLDPSHRLCQVNLKLLRKLRESQGPTGG